MIGTTMTMQPIGMAGLMVWMLAVAGLSGCWTRTVRLHNTQSGEVIRGEYGERPAPTGSFAVTLPSGERLEGEYSIARGGGVQWGSIYTTVYGQGTISSGSAVGSTVSIGGRSPGIAVASGPQGTVVECEFVTDAFESNMIGACRDNRGTPTGSSCSSTHTDQAQAVPELVSTHGQRRYACTEFAPLQTNQVSTARRGDTPSAGRAAIMGRAQVTLHRSLRTNGLTGAHTWSL